MNLFKRIFKTGRKKPEPGKTEKTEEIKLLEESRRKFYSALINPGDLVFDIGANMGNRIAPFLEIGARVVAVEPQKECVEYLKKTYGDHIILIDKAIGASAGLKDFYISDINTISSFSEDWINAVKESGRFAEFNWEKAGPIEMITLDDLIKMYGIPGFIKIDVEGYELEVLKGLSKKIKYLSFEYTVPEQTQKCIECIKQLTDIDTNSRFNYCAGENMEFVLPDWLTAEQMLTYVNSQDFINTGFGDVYARMD